ncbi:hypothetical protein [Streptomyces sp. RG80]|uniref:hypothetical protein n=1 Tax=Streptomyces sp. RG80 TaxID=3157340 RepID=UPI00338F30D8
MGTSLTPEFWERFAVLLVAAMALTVALAAAADELYLRMARRCGRGRVPQAPPRAVGTHRRAAVHL